MLSPLYGVCPNCKTTVSLTWTTYEIGKSKKDEIEENNEKEL